MIRSLLPKISDAPGPNRHHGKVGYLNLFNYSTFRHNPEAIAHFDRITLDGIMLLKLLALLTGRKFNRASPDFSSYFEPLFSWFEQEKVPLAFVGGTKADIQLFEAQMKAKYPGLNAVFYRHGFELDQDALAGSLQSTGAKVLILGLGSPKQEIFAGDLWDRGGLESIYTCGAFISQTADGGTVYYPHWANKLHLRWLYRIYKEPKLFKRYLIHYPAGVLRVLRDYYRPK